MTLVDLIHIDIICRNYQLESSFLTEIHQSGLIKLEYHQDIPYIHPEEITTLEKILHLNNELDINLEGIEVIVHLLEKIETLQDEIVLLKNRLDIYER